MPRLQGRDVVLRPLLMEDVAALAAAASESRQHYLFNPVPDGLAQTQNYVDRALGQFERRERIPFVIEFHGRVVGSTSYANIETWYWPSAKPEQREGNPDAVEIGYTWLAQSAQRTRCNTEAKFLLLSHAFESWTVQRVLFRTDKRNSRSRCAIERLGAQFEGIRRADMPAMDGGIRDSAFYSIISSDWPTVRDHILGLLEAYP